nr:ABC transporter ATP-binding protein [uncultured Oscillibacter sp.]
MTYAFEMRGITKRFPGVTANEDVSLAVEWGTVHGLIGENGAGKTTLMKILYGMYSADKGDIFINGEKVSLRSPKDAIAKGVGMVHQHFTLVPSLTVAQNIILGKPVCKWNGLVDISKANQLVDELSERYGMPVKPDISVGELPVAMQQRVEILKALYLGADTLIMDEPTAVLTPQEIERLLETLSELRRQGKCIVLITHKLKELLSVTDNITVLRSGKVTGRVKTSESSEKEIAAMMVGKEISLEVPKGTFSPGKDILRVENLDCYDRMGVHVLKDVNFQVREGEIVGIAGVQGNGQTELIEAIAGMRSDFSGSVTINGKKFQAQDTTLSRRNAGLSHIPEDRQKTGAALESSILNNFLMGGLKNPAYTTRHTIRYKKAADAAQAQLQKFDVRYAGLNMAAGALSGGNLQKVIVAREFYQEPSVLIAAQPSRGVDIGATMFIHERLIELRDSGKAVLLVSGELSEIMSLSDRILVLYNGEIVGETTPSESTEEDIGLLMAGIQKKEGCP